MKTILFRLGPFSISLFGTFIALGIAAGFYILNQEAKRKNLDQDEVFNLALYSIIAAIVGARLYYVLIFNPAYYLKNPSEIIMIQQGGLSIQGGLFGAILVAGLYLNKKELSFWKVADAFAPAIILGQAIGRIGCDVFGVAMDKVYPWGVKISGQLLHPAQAYEIILNYILFAILWNRRDKVKYNGELFLLYIIGFSINRGIVEFFRSNPIVFKPFTVAHLTSLIIIVIAGVIMRFIKNEKGDSPQQLRVTPKRKLIDNLIILVGMIFSVLTYYSFY
ncbi:phosphatidylglycerol:prolipoprotein diacylglycerol transferase [Orenia metallireducens]|uniref:Phosphatidylglycerol--prolipoprotein diacylglyceryl transferase n=1 Tax=Orenia metallireducens TaxID=1413210 RepID=A0A285IE25_9FIRM|nr:prolipoprotein diacylglyceryl transferase [Orenia metallireducens]PRX19234.1 phosphatidylglycerol:prolipoprotein diacylglycerol transferase [Orenia metallireducens]SNY46220.1 phosphatidylglycerol:prolipoprotein diacylglycerol transferase [Orenia metallireducens]